MNDTKLDTEKFGMLVEYAKELMERHKVPGVAIGLVSGEETYTAGLGVTSLENPLPVTPDTLFRIGSITKTHTATAAFQLIEQGKLSLDERVRKYIPYFKVADEQTAACVTVRQLLNHTSGWMGDFFINTGDGDDALEKFVQRMADLPQLTPLGALYTYNNAALNVLGRIIEILTGKTYDAALREMVLEPLEMTSSWFLAQDVMLHRFALGHNTIDGKVVVAKPWFESRCDAPCGGLSSSVRDMLKYTRFHMGDGRTSNGDRLLTPLSLEQMQTPGFSSGGGEWVGLDWFIKDLDGVRLVTHGGSSNGQQADLWMAPERQTAFTVLTNHGLGNSLIDKLNRWVCEHFLGLVEAEPVPQPLPDELLGEFAGRYVLQASGDIFEFTLRSGGLHLAHTISEGSKLFDAEREPLPPMYFLSCSPDEFITQDEPFSGFMVEFLRDMDGQIQWARFGGRVLARQT